MQEKLLKIFITLEIWAKGACLPGGRGRAFATTLATFMVGRVQDKFASAIFPSWQIPTTKNVLPYSRVALNDFYTMLIFEEPWTGLSMSMLILSQRFKDMKRLIYFR